MTGRVAAAPAFKFRTMLRNPRSERTVNRNHMKIAIPVAVDFLFVRIDITIASPSIIALRSAASDVAVSTGAYLPTSML